MTNFPTLWFHRTFTPSAHADLHGIEADDSRGLYWTSSAVLGHCSSGHLHVTQLHLNNKNVMLVGWLVVLHETLWNPKTSDILHLPEFWTIKSIFAHRSQIYQELSMSSLLEGQYFFGGDKNFMKSFSRFGESEVFDWHCGCHHLRRWWRRWVLLCVCGHVYCLSVLHRWMCSNGRYPTTGAVAAKWNPTRLLDIYYIL